MLDLRALDDGAPVLLETNGQIGKRAGSGLQAVPRMRKQERKEWMDREQKLLDLLTSERYAHRLEVKELLNRIQHPEIRDVAIPDDYVPPEPPKDLAELAHIGREVPEFVNVGSATQIQAEQSEIDKIGTIQE